MRKFTDADYNRVARENREIAKKHRGVTGTDNWRMNTRMRRDLEDILLREEAEKSRTVKA